MRGRDGQKKPSEALTGELMLAKGVIEEKNEQLDQKDSAIRTLSSRLEALQAECEEARIELSRSRRQDAIVRAEERANTLSAVIKDIVGVAASYEDVYGSSSTGLASRLYLLLQEKYDLRVIADSPRSVDPALHHVVEVDHNGTQEGSIEILANGYRLGNVVIRPALVKVILGLRSGQLAANGPGLSETTRRDDDE